MVKYRLINVESDVNNQVSIVIREIKDDGSEGAGFAVRVPLTDFQSWNFQTLKQKIQQWAEDRVAFIVAQPSSSKLNAPNIEVTV